MPKKKAKPRHYDKPLSLYPLSFEEAVTVLLHTPPLKNSEKKKRPRKPKENIKP